MFRHFLSWFSLSFTFFFWNYRFVSWPSSDVQGGNAQPGQECGLGNPDLPTETVQAAWAWGWRHLMTLAIVPQDLWLIHGPVHPLLVNSCSSSVGIGPCIVHLLLPPLSTRGFDFSQSMGCGYTLYFLVLMYLSGMARDEWKIFHWPCKSPRETWLQRDPLK